MPETTVSSHDDIIVELDDAEIAWWRSKIGEVRKRFVKGPKDLIDDYFKSEENKVAVKEAIKNTSQFIRDVRSTTWEEYVKSELLFYKEIVRTLLSERRHLREILAHSIDKDVLQGLIAHEEKDKLIDFHSAMFGDFAGRIFPYFYELAKSVTQSRRSRAGTEFETLVANIMSLYGYPYNSQSQLGQRIFEEKGLGKKVDGLVPNIEAFTNNRSKCLVLTMKTTIRERWQEVVEELNRTNVPSIHLLTLDEGMTSNTLTLMKNHNITLVTYKEIKESFPDFSNIISFESLFNEEIPHVLDWWKKNHPGLLLQSPVRQGTD